MLLTVILYFCGWLLHRHHTTFKSKVSTLGLRVQPQQHARYRRMRRQRTSWRTARWGRRTQSKGRFRQRRRSQLTPSCWRRDCRCVKRDRARGSAKRNRLRLDMSFEGGGAARQDRRCADIGRVRREAGGVPLQGEERPPGGRPPRTPGDRRPPPQFRRRHRQRRRRGRPKLALRRHREAAPIGTPGMQPAGRPFPTIFPPYRN